MSTPTQAEPIKRVRLDYIDALRGIAALMVLVCHSLQVDTSLQLPAAVSDGFEACKAGVQLFFVISAFTIFYSLHHSDGNTGRFFIRRFFRIAPLYFLAVVVYSILFHSNSTGILLNLFFLHGFSPKYINSVVPGGWSIGIEMLFYCAIPYLAKRITTLGRSLYFFAGAVILAFLLLYGVRKGVNLSPDAESFIYFWLPNQLPVFALGFILYFLTFTTPKLNRDVSKPLLIIGALAIIALFTKLTLFGPHLLFGMVVMSIIYIIGKNQATLLVNKASLFLGKISYSLYLSQYVSIVILTKSGLSSPLPFKLGAGAVGNLLINLALLALVTILLSVILYKVIEEPFQQFGKKIIKSRTKETSIIRPAKVKIVASRSSLPKD